MSYYRNRRTRVCALLLQPLYVVLKAINFRLQFVCLCSGTSATSAYIKFVNRRNFNTKVRQRLSNGREIAREEATAVFLT